MRGGGGGGLQSSGSIYKPVEGRCEHGNVPSNNCWLLKDSAPFSRLKDEDCDCRDLCKGTVWLLTWTRTMKILGQDSQPPERDMNPGPPKYARETDKDYRQFYWKRLRPVTKQKPCCPSPWVPVSGGKHTNRGTPYASKDDYNMTSDMHQFIKMADKITRVLNLTCITKCITF
jgi:hypothetical protein